MGHRIVLTFDADSKLNNGNYAYVQGATVCEAGEIPKLVFESMQSGSSTVGNQVCRLSRMPSFTINDSDPKSEFLKNLAKQIKNTAPIKNLKMHYTCFQANADKQVLMVSRQLSIYNCTLAGEVDVEGGLAHVRIQDIIGGVRETEYVLQDLTFTAAEVNYANAKNWNKEPAMRAEWSDTADDIKAGG